MKTGATLLKIAPRRRAALRWLALTLVVTACSGESPPLDRETGFPGPAPSLTPRDVVSAQLEALQRAGGNDQAADRAMAAAYAFASPRNKAGVGSLEDFSSMVRGSYADMVAHDQVILTIVRQGPTQAAIAAALLTDGRQPRNYMFILARQTEGEYTDCWMTDAVLPLPSDSPEALQAI
jgi:hypothetical protein